MDKSTYVEVLDQGKIRERIEAVPREAERFVFLVSPYLAMDKLRGLTREIRQALKRGVKIRLVFREKDTSTSGDVLSSTEIRSLMEDGLELYMVKDLHAKIYMNDKGLLLTSMNLLESSFNNSIEIGTWFDKAHPAFAETVKYLQVHIRQNWSQVDELPAPVITQKKPKQTSSETADVASLFDDGDEKSKRGVRQRREASSEEGFCIRCRASLDLDPEKPLCRDCYAVWKRHEDPAYIEKFCHQCGEPQKTSLAKPLCRDCWSDSRA